jgi:hypothetical protein
VKKGMKKGVFLLTRSDKKEKRRSQGDSKDLCQARKLQVLLLPPLDKGPTTESSLGL